MQNLSETNINTQKEVQTEHGRSMVETLGVLAIIGVLSIGVLWVINGRWINIWPIKWQMKSE